MTVVYYLVAALLVVLDQVTKLLTRAYLAGQGTVVVIPHVVGLTYVENTGMAFSAFSGYTAVLAVLSFAVSLLLIVAIKKRWLSHPFCQWMLTLILAGAVGNLIDRVFMGYVTDMIQTLFMEFAIFNVADCCVVIGTIALAAYLVFFYKEDKSSKTEETQP
ncbi:MAG: signal peptidase II [Oscillospiraceae bacterium]|nr:signal peptidase II [Oscillospiraceae bacterium]